VRRKLIFICAVVTVLFVGGFLVKDRVLQVISPAKTVNPIYKQSAIYDLVTILEKNGYFVSPPPIFVNDSIQASISGITAVFSPEKDLFSQVRSLQLVLGRLKMEEKNAKEIDLRFNKVVVRY